MSLDAKTLRQTIAAWGHAESETPPRYGDDLRADGINPERRASAVMLILLDTGTDISLVLTQRAAHLPKHPGQISFPGGRAELEDEASTSERVRRDRRTQSRRPARAFAAAPARAAAVAGKFSPTASRRITGASVHHQTHASPPARSPLDVIADVPRIEPPSSPIRRRVARSIPRVDYLEPDLVRKMRRP